MNITEANDTNKVLRYLLGLPGATDDQARDAAARLADRASKTTLTGLTGKDVTAAWPNVEVCPLPTLEQMTDELEVAESRLRRTTR